MSTPPPTPPSRGHELIKRFLGPDSLGRGPFGLLGLDPGASTPSAVEAALQRQLDRITQHPDADSDGADAVRLVLDTAATELLDPVTRAKWITEVVGSGAGFAAEPNEVRPPGSFAAPPVDVVARETDRPRRRIAEDAPAADWGVGGVGVDGDPLVKRTIIIAVVGLVVLFGGLAIGVLLLSASGGGKGGGSPPDRSTAASGTGSKSSAVPAQSAPSATAPPPTPPPVLEPLAPLRTRGRSEFADGAQVVRELGTAANEMSADPDRALARFERAFAVAADWWCRYDDAQIVAAVNQTVECLYRASARPDHAARLLALVREPAVVLASPGRPVVADEVWPAAWSAAVLARASRERDLPPQVAASIAQAASAAFGPARATSELSLEGGVAAAMRALPAAILRGNLAAEQDAAAATAQATAAIRRWIEGVALIARAESGADRRERMFVDALSWMMTDAPEAGADPRIFESIGLVGAEIKWRSGGPARARLMDWFRDPRVSDQDLRTLTAAIAGKSSAEGIDASMVLSMSAAGGERVRLRGAYAAAWGLAEASTRADAAREWVVRARAASEFVPREDELDQLASAAELAEINREAVKIWRGEAIAAASGASSARSPFMPALGSASVANAGPVLGSVTGSAADGAWAERYLGAERNIPVRLERLLELEQGGTPVGWIDAGVLAEAACFASPMQVPATRIRSVADLYARISLAALPRPTDADWELLARRALVERLLAMVADEGIHGHIEQLASRIAAAYLDAAGESPAGGSTDASAIGARRGAALLADAARLEAAGLPITRATRFSLEQVAKRSAQRRAQALGPIQSFAAEQAGLAEWLAYLVAAERPERETAAVEVIDQAATQRRKARHVFAQIWAAERAMARLWLLRLDMEGPS